MHVLSSSHSKCERRTGLSIWTVPVHIGGHMILYCLSLGFIWNGSPHLRCRESSSFVFTIFLSSSVLFELSSIHMLPLARTRRKKRLRSSITSTSTSFRIAGMIEYFTIRSSCNPAPASDLIVGNTVNTWCWYRSHPSAAHILTATYGPLWYYVKYQESTVLPVEGGTVG